MRHEEVEDLAGGDAAVQVIAERVRPVLALRHAEAVGLQVVGASTGTSIGGTPRSNRGKPTWAIFLRSLTRISVVDLGNDQAILDGQPIDGWRGVVVKFAVALFHQASQPVAGL